MRRSSTVPAPVPLDPGEDMITPSERLISLVHWLFTRVSLSWLLSSQ
jgi:hypothetical protein